MYIVHIGIPGDPEVNLCTGAWVQPLQKVLWRILFQNLLDQMCPTDDHGLNSMDDCPVKAVRPNKKKGWLRKGTMLRL